MVRALSCVFLEDFTREVDTRLTRSDSFVHARRLTAVLSKQDVHMFLGNVSKFYKVLNDSRKLSVYTVLKPF